MGIKKVYSKPSMFLESFQPQEYCDVCMAYVQNTDPVNGVTIHPSFRFWLDYNQDHIINGTDYVVGPAEHNTDGSSAWGEASTFRFAWWAASEEIANTIVNSTSPMDEFRRQQADKKAGHVEAVKKKGGSDHYYAGDVIKFENHS